MLSDETIDGILFGLRLARKQPRQSTIEYNAAVKEAKQHALSMSQNDLVAILKANCPSYIEELLYTEDERFGSGSLAERYARTFWKKYTKKQKILL